MPHLQVDTSPPPLSCSPPTANTQDERRCSNHSNISCHSDLELEIEANYTGVYGFGHYKLTFSKRVLGCVDRENPVRAMCIKVIKLYWFDGLVLAVILANSILMALYNPVDIYLNISSPVNQALVDGEWFFQPFFTLEAVIKIVALGLYVKPSGYFRDPWNILDFVIVVTGWIPIIMESLNDGHGGASPFMVFRFARVLRPLRALRMFPSLEQLICSILSAAKQIAEVLLLCGCILLIFGLVGLTLFKGKLRQHCGYFDNSLNEMIIPIDEMEMFCSFEPHKYGRQCPDGLECFAAGFNPSSGLTSFDNIYLTMLTVFQVITLEGWSSIMFALFDTSPQVYGIYFILLILFGGYFITNLLVSALSVNYKMIRLRNERKNAVDHKDEDFLTEFVDQERQKRDNCKFTNMDARKRVALMQMRLMVSHERNEKSVVTKEMYEFYCSQTDPTTYRRWKRRFLRKSHTLNASTSFISNDSSFNRKREYSVSFQDSMSSAHEIYTKLKKPIMKDKEELLNQRRRKGSSISEFFELEEQPCDDGDCDKGASFLSFQKEGEGEGLFANQEFPEARESSLSSSTNGSCALGAQKASRPIRKFVYKYITRTAWFNCLVLLAIVINTIILALEHFGQPARMFQAISISNNVFLALFTVEAVLRITSDGFHHYFSNGFNCLDFIIIILGYVQLVADSPSLTVLRTLRILRFARFAEQWETLGSLLVAVQKTFKQIAPYLVFLGVCLYIFTVSGLHFFGGRLTISRMVETGEYVLASGDLVNATLEINPEFDCTKTVGNFYLQLDDGNYTWHCPKRTNYDTFLWSFITTFQVITGEDWNGVMEAAVDSTGSFAAVVYFVFLMLFGSFIILNFFLAILLDTFIQLHDDDVAKKREDEILEAMNGESRGSFSMPSSRSLNSGSKRTLGRGESLKRILDKRKKKVYDLTEQEVLKLDAFQCNSLHCISPNNKYRVWAGILIHKQLFDYFIILVILWSCVLLALEHPTDPILSSGALFYQNLVITAIFLVEAVLKIFALGFVRHRGSYLRSKWNILDFVILVVSILDLFLSSSETDQAKLLRAARALRPLRAIQRFEGLRIVVQSFASAILPCIQVMVLCLLFYAMFSIISITLFSGRLFACYECDMKTNSCIRNFTSDRVCMNYPEYGMVDCKPENTCAGTDPTGTLEYKWLNPTYGSLNERQFSPANAFSFDSFPTSWLTLFEVSSMEMWMEPMYAVSDIVSFGIAPVRGSNDLASLFFIVFIFVLQYFMLQVFVAVLINTYLDSTHEETGEAYMSPQQLQWVALNRRALNRPYKSHTDLLMRKSGSRVQLVCLRIVSNDKFHNFIYGVIIANTFWMMLDHYDPSPLFSKIFYSVDTIFGSIYVVEAVLKLTGYGISKYFESKGNRFDFFVVVTLIVNWILGCVAGAQEVDAFRAIETLRVVRVFRLFKLVPALRILLSTLLCTLVPLANVLLLMAIVFFVFSVLGVNLYGTIELSDDFEFLNEHVNFQTFSNAFYSLFVICSGENWVAISREMSSVKPGAVVYCTCFVIIVTLIMLNLFVAVILTNYTTMFERSSQRDKNGAKTNLDENNFRDFNKVWNDLHLEYIKGLTDEQHLKQRKREIADTEVHQAALEKATTKLEVALAKGSTILPADYFLKLILQLKAPLGFKKRSLENVNFTPGHVLKFIKDKPVPVNTDGDIEYHTTLRTLIDINLLNGESPSSEVSEFLAVHLSKERREQFRAIEEEVDINDDRENIVDVIAREQIVRMIRSYVFKWRLKHLKRNGANDEVIRHFLKTGSVMIVDNQTHHEGGIVEDRNQHDVVIVETQNQLDPVNMEQQDIQIV